MSPTREADSFPRRLPEHTRRRCAQRGTNLALLAELAGWADVEVPVGRATTALSLSRAAAAEMRAEGVPGGLVERARRRVLLEAEGTPITVIAGRERRGRHYRRRMNPRPGPRRARALARSR